MSSKNNNSIKNNSIRNNSIKNNNLKVNPNVMLDYKFIIAIIIILLIAGIFYTNSKGYLVGKTNKQLGIIEKYNQIRNYEEDESIPLRKLKISSSFNSVGRYRILHDYQDPSILKSLLRIGCRYIELNIFAKDFKHGSDPVVNSGYKNGQWKKMLNSIELDECIEVIKQNSFSKLTNINGAPNNEDPLFIGLNLHTGYNLKTLDKVSEIIINKLADKLLPPQYSYQYDSDFHNIEFNKLRNKIIIFASPGFEGSKLEEIINASWVDETQLDLKDTFINYLSSNSKDRNKYENFENDTKEENNIDESRDLYDNLLNDVLNKRTILRISAKTINSYGFDSDYLRRHNKSGLTIVVPNVEGDILPTNYDPTVAWDLGCQFVAMNFQYLDSNVDKYVMEFRRQGIKPS